MGDWREERSGEAGERWKTGPLGNEGDEETRRIPRQERSEPERPENGGEDAPRRVRREPSGPLGWDEEPETREVRPRRNRSSTGRENRDGSGTREWALPQQPARRTESPSIEDLRRDLYGGVDWLASFVGTVFAAVTGAIMFFIGGGSGSWAAAVILGAAGGRPQHKRIYGPRRRGGNTVFRVLFWRLRLRETGAL